MPILHIQLNNQARTPPGDPMVIPSALSLRQRGPITQVSVSLGEEVSQDWLRMGIPLPGAITGLALIDTGAAKSSIDDTIAKKLGLPVVDVTYVASATHENHPLNVYPVRFTLVGALISGDIPRALGANLQPQGLIALIGRDILQHCTLFYNGVSGEFTLSM